MMKWCLAAAVLLLALTSSAEAKPKSVAELVTDLKDDGFGILLEVVAAADPAILATLSDPKLAATVFAPTDEAFARLLKDLKISKKDLLKQTDLITQVLLYHVVPAPVKSTDLKIRQTVQTALEGKTGLVKITNKYNAHLKEQVVRLYTTSDGTAKVIQADVLAGKSVVHAINRVLIPGNKKPQ